MPGRYPLIPKNNNLTDASSNPKDYWDSMQKVELEIGNQEQFKDLPDLKTKNPFAETIILGVNPQNSMLSSI